MKGNTRSGKPAHRERGRVETPQQALIRTIPGRQAADGRYLVIKSGCFNKQGGTANALTGIRPGSYAGRMPFDLAKAPTHHGKKTGGENK